MTNEQLAHYKMDDEERAEWNSLIEQIYEDCKKADIPESGFKRYVDSRVVPYDFENNRGYCKSLGYYDVYTERGCNELRFIGDRAGMRFYLLKQILWGIGTQLELESRARLTLAWKLKYRTKYDSRKFHFEYEINKIDKILGQDYSAQLIAEHTAHMNRWFEDEHWAFDRSTGKFIEITKSEEIR